LSLLYAGFVDGEWKRVLLDENDREKLKNSLRINEKKDDHLEANETFSTSNSNQQLK
jgi:hypothetical protein